MTAKDHYDNHLGNFYSWMYGDFRAKQHDQEQFFHKHGITPSSSTGAIDLGAGHGLQTVSLVKLGFNVTAVDFNDQLLQELKINSADRATIVKDDIIDFLTRYDKGAEVITCMGDTITHLESMDRINSLLKECRRILIENGKIVISFRDLTSELTGKTRFIPVKSDNTRIATCFLEYFQDHVMVYDILQEKINDEWHQKISCYPKLRLSLKIVHDLLVKTKFQILHSETVNGMVYVIAQKFSYG